MTKQVPETCWSCDHPVKSKLGPKDWVTPYPLCDECKIALRKVRERKAEVK